MSIQEFVIHPIDMRAASGHEYACFNAFQNRMRAEVLPEDPPIPCEEDAEHHRAMPACIKEGTWTVWDSPRQRMLAFATIHAEYSGDNMHAAEFSVQVLPQVRRRGIGRALLRRVVAFANEHKRSLLIASSNERVPAGGEFLARIGARKGLEGGENQLSLTELDRSLLERWLQKGEALSREFRLEVWDGPVPQDYLAGMIAMVQAWVNDEPRDTLELEDSTHVADTYRDFEAWTFAGGRRRWLLVAIHRPDERLVAMTEVVWSPARPQILEQWGTGVQPDYRCRGIGRWLKATMLEKILRELPEARVIRTGNANSNAPMLKINNELGFKPFISRPAWQVETRTVERYLTASA